MIESRYPTVCSNCGDQMPVGTKISRDEEGEWQHADGCVGDIEDFLGVRPNSEKRVPGVYKGKKLSVCRMCFTTSCDCGPGRE